MRKIPTLFKRDPKQPQLVTREYSDSPEVQQILKCDPNCLTVSKKWDGTAVAIIGTSYYGRRVVKRNKPVPEFFLPAQKEDPVTGQTPGWLPIRREDRSRRWHIAALEHYAGENAIFTNKAGVVTAERQHLTCGTFEAVGPHFQGNPHKLETDTLISHWQPDVVDFPMSFGFNEIQKWMGEHPDAEGVVIKLNEQIATKIKRRDFGFSWPS